MPDILLAMQEIQDHIVWTISENKRQLKLELKDNERNAIIDLYCRMALGEYGSTYKESRAIGLWLWDRIYMKKNSKTKADAVKAFKEQCKK